MGILKTLSMISNNIIRVEDLEGIFHTYRNFLPIIKFSGPTLMRPTICEAMKIARGFKNNGSEKYVILTILTDG